MRLISESVVGSAWGIPHENPGRIYGRRVEGVTFDADTLNDVKQVFKVRRVTPGRHRA